jgi:hypothetical protein
MVVKRKSQPLNEKSEAEIPSARHDIFVFGDARLIVAHRLIHGPSRTNVKCSSKNSLAYAAFLKPQLFSGSSSGNGLLNYVYKTAKRRRGCLAPSAAFTSQPDRAEQSKKHLQICPKSMP